MTDPLHGLNDLDVHAWQQSHRKPGGQFVQPVTGFAGGRLTLWLPSPEVQTRLVFRDGKPMRETIPSCMTDPALCELRARAMREMTLSEVELIAEGGLSFIEYAAAVVATNYTFTDEELGVVFDGTKWHQGIVEHMLGGEAMLEVLSRRHMNQPAPTDESGEPGEELPNV